MPIFLHSQHKKDAQVCPNSKDVSVSTIKHSDRDSQQPTKEEQKHIILIGKPFMQYRLVDVDHLPPHTFRRTSLVQRFDAAAASFFACPFFVFKFDVSRLRFGETQKDEHHQTYKDMKGHYKQGRVPEADIVVKYAANRRSDEGTQCKGTRPQSRNQTKSFQVVLEAIGSEETIKIMRFNLFFIRLAALTCQFAEHL